MAELKLITYKEERLIYFTDQRKLIKKQYDRLEKQLNPMSRIYPNAGNF